MASRKALAASRHITLPNTIPCNECKVQKTPEMYSENRLLDLRKYITQCEDSRKSKAKEQRSFDPSKTAFIRCSLCVGHAPVEQTCFHCNVTYSRNDRKYFSSNMLKNRKDEALCWACSQAEQNETLSSGDDDNGSDASDDSDGTFVTNRFEDDDASTISGITKGMYSYGLGQPNALDNSSGGVSLSSPDASSRAGTIYKPASSAASTGGGSPSVSASLASQASQASRVPVTPGASQATRASPSSTGRGFNPHAYGHPGLRSPTGSVASTSAFSSGFAKVKSGPRKVDMDTARLQKKEMKDRAAFIGKDDVQVED